MTMTEMLSTEPEAKAILIKFLAISSGYNCYFITFWILAISA